MMPVWAEVYYELVFGEPCPPAARELIVANADDVVTALKGTGLRHMDRRDRLTRYLLGRIEHGTCPVLLPPPFTDRETAWYLQGAFFNTAVVQMSEAMAHVLLNAATHAGAVPDPGDDAALDRFIDETLRVHPLFGVAHRITSAPIVVDDRVDAPGRVGPAVQLPRLPAHRAGRGRRVRPGPLADARPPGRALHPVRRGRQPGLPGPRGGPGDAARRHP